MNIIGLIKSESGEASFEQIFSSESCKNWKNYETVCNVVIVRPRSGGVVTKHYYKMGKVCIVWPITDAQMATAEIFTKSMNTSSYYFKVKRTSKDSIGEGAQQRSNRNEEAL